MAAPLIPILTIASIDSVARQSTAAGLLVDLPDAVLAGYDLAGHGDDRKLARTLTDSTGVVDTELLDLDHDCLSCTLRETIVPDLELITDLGRWQQVAVLLPAATAPGPLARTLAHGIGTGALTGARLAPVITALDTEAVLHDVLDDDLLAERALAHGAQDRRSVGESVCAMVEYGDATVTVGGAPGPSTALLSRLITTLDGPAAVHQTDWRELIRRDHDVTEASRRSDPMSMGPARVGDEHGVWSIDLCSDRPFHPGRLMDRLEDLGSGRLRGLGHFWLPSRPESICTWDGSGGQLSIGHHDFWRGRPRQTRLVITGIDEADRRRVDAAFRAVVMTPRELQRLDQWASVDDGFDPWLGARLTAA